MRALRLRGPCTRVGFDIVKFEAAVVVSECRLQVKWRTTNTAWQEMMCSRLENTKNSYRSSGLPAAFEHGHQKHQYSGHRGIDGRLRN